MSERPIRVEFSVAEATLVRDLLRGDAQVARDLTGEPSQVNESAEVKVRAALLLPPEEDECGPECPTQDAAKDYGAGRVQ